MAPNVPGDASQASVPRRRTRGMPAADLAFSFTVAETDAAADERDLTSLAGWLMERRAARLAGAARSAS